MKLRNPNRELFCKLYASNKEFFGNGVQSYAKAYNLDLRKKGSYNTAKSGATELLTNPFILERIDELMDIYINDQVVDKELAFVIMQKDDLHAKVSAIREYNKLKQRVIEKIEHSGKIDTGKLSMEEIDAKIAELERRLKEDQRGESSTAATKDVDKGK